MTEGMSCEDIKTFLYRVRCLASSGECEGWLWFSLMPCSIDSEKKLGMEKGCRKRTLVTELARESII